MLSVTGMVTNPLRDIFRYVPSAFPRHNGKDMIRPDNPYAQQRDPEKVYDDDPLTSFEYTKSPYSSDSAQWNPWSIKKGSFLENLNNQYGAGFNLGIPHSDGKTALQGDWSKLPKTKFGTIDNVMPVEKHQMKNLKNPKLVYNDPEYGVITPMSNWKSNNEWLGPAMMAAASMGMGGLMAGGGALAKLGVGAVNAGKQLGTTGSFNPIGLASTAIGAFVPGASSWINGPAGHAARIALQQFYARQKRPGG